MDKLKEYKNLYALYSKIQKKYLIVIIALFIIFLSSFALFITDVPIGIPSLMMIMIIPAIIMLILYFVMKHTAKKSLDRFTEDELNRIDQDLETTEFNEGYGVTRDAIIVVKQRLFIYPIKDLVWIYKHITSTKLYGVLTVSKASAIVIAGKDHKRYSYKTKNKSNIVEFLKFELDQYNSAIFYGYSPELDVMFRKNFNQMLSLLEEEKINQ